MCRLHFCWSQHVLFNTTHCKFLVAISRTPTYRHSHELIVNQCFSSEQMRFQLNSTNLGSVGSVFGINAELLPPQTIYQTRVTLAHVSYPPPHPNVETNVRLTTGWTFLSFFRIIQTVHKVHSFDSVLSKWSFEGEQSEGGLGYTPLFPSQARVLLSVQWTEANCPWDLASSRFTLCFHNLSLSLSIIHVPPCCYFCFSHSVNTHGIKCEFFLFFFLLGHHID